MADTKEVIIPDIGGATDVEVIEILVKPGDQIKAEQSLITLEGDKATMEIPAPFAGVVDKLTVKVGDKVSEGHKILSLKASGDQAADTGKDKKASAEPEQQASETAEKATKQSEEKQATAQQADNRSNQETAAPKNRDIYASPSVRRIAHELEIDLNLVRGSGEKGRITKQDVKSFLSQSSTGGGVGIPEMPAIDFSQFGEIEEQPLNKIKKLTATNVHRSWLVIPHVTQFAEADITDMEEFRKANKNLAEKQGTKLTPIVFVMKAVVAAMKKFPQFNSSLHPSGEKLILKKYFHVGVAVDTPNGLVVPVIRDVDQKGMLQLAKELQDISTKAREKGLSTNDMAGSCFTISSLGGIGGTAFTPIVKAPDVAILGLSRSEIKPVYQDGKFIPRLMLPISLSYDHRVIDGAEAARFTVFLTEQLSDLRNLLM